MFHQVKEERKASKAPLLVAEIRTYAGEGTHVKRQKLFTMEWQ